MAQQTIDIGAAPNDGTGDPIRDAFDKCNDNFTELYNGLAGLLDLKGSTDCSANPNYPAASKGDAYVVSVAGKIGGGSGVTVEVGDVYFATADNAGGTQAAVGTSWSVIQGNVVAGAGGVNIEDEGVSELLAASTLNFTGTGVTAADQGGGVVDITIPGGISTFALGDATDVDTAGAAAGNVLEYDGAEWVPAVPSGGYEAGPPTPPTTADLATWDNQGTSTATDGTGALVLKPQVDSVMHGRYKAAPATPYDVYCRVNSQWLSTAATTAGVTMAAGIMFKDTGGDNERLTFGIFHDRIAGDEQMTHATIGMRWSGASPPVFSATILQKYSVIPWQWLRVNNDGTTLTFYVSMDGKNWITVGTETLAAFIDGAASFGVWSYATANATEAAALFSYFSTTAPT